MKFLDLTLLGKTQEPLTGLALWHIEVSFSDPAKESDPLPKDRIPLQVVGENWL